MRSRRWGLIAVIALVLAGVLLGITLIWGRGPEASVSSTPTVTTEEAVMQSPSPPPTPAIEEPVTYTVQAGDTLSAIAQEHGLPLEALTRANDLPDPDVLQIGQVLIIPDDENNASPDPIAARTPVEDLSAGSGDVVIPPTITPSGPPLVEISRVTGIGDLEAETIVLVNHGGMVSLEAWTLSSPTDDQFALPALTLFPEGEVRLHSTEGNNTPRNLYWGRTGSVWQKGELITLRDAAGNVVDTYIAPE